MTMNFVTGHNISKNSVSEKLEAVCGGLRSTVTTGLVVGDTTEEAGILVTNIPGKNAVACEILDEGEVAFTANAKYSYPSRGGMIFFLRGDSNNVVRKDEVVVL